MNAVATEDELASRSECWCCGAIEDSAKVVHLGNHPEVALCMRCARWASKQANEIEDSSRTGLAVMLRNRARVARGVVIHKGWHRIPIIGAALRQLGPHTP